MILVRPPAFRDKVAAVEKTSESPPAEVGNQVMAEGRNDALLAAGIPRRGPPPAEESVGRTLAFPRGVTR